jgi:hypothetical protein
MQLPLVIMDSYGLGYLGYEEVVLEERSRRPLLLKVRISLFV